MIYLSKISDTVIPETELREMLFEVLDRIGPQNKVLAIPPDYTRMHSRAGALTTMLYTYYGDTLTDILPALGTHSPMTGEQIGKMFKNVPVSLFREHNWRKDLVTLGKVPAHYIHQISEGKVNFDWPAQVNKLLVEGKFDAIFSIGQVVPHEVIGMANYNKNIFIGTGGTEGINKSHFMGALYGMERIMGRSQNPVRDVLNYASSHFAKDLRIVYMLTVIGNDMDGNQGVMGLFIGDEEKCFLEAASLSLKLNFNMLDRPLKKVIVYLNPSEYKSTWLGNKSIYRTRMALADHGELIILAPGLREFGEDPEIDRLIRKYGYRTTDEILAHTRDSEELQKNLSAAAHLIHGSSENRFSITYCPGHLTRKEIESVNYSYADLASMLRKYNPDLLRDGFNDVDNEEIYFISNPALGLWTYRENFK